MITAPMLEQREAMVAFGWTVVSDYGYSHRSGWTIGVCRVRGRWVTELWDGMSLHANVDSPLAAARLHRDLVGELDSTSSGELDGPHDAPS
ncbi:hypothetical protein [Burkholderia sp. BCC1047]|uniref:hypothetical protein n=1 Tax=Burkholderia sp. BCC1047 TaxID=2676299 RepID=UPI00158BBD4C|nr:hypothetical protein [Burkholderia sp. BCC1047]